MKTTLELLNELPEPYRSRAVENAKAQNADMAKPSKTIQGAISNAFVFDKTPEGFEYWLDLCCELADKKSLEKFEDRRYKLSAWIFISSLIVGAMLWAFALLGFLSLFF